jgi:hypothetical protein
MYINLPQDILATVKSQGLVEKINHDWHYYTLERFTMAEGETERFFTFTIIADHGPIPRHSIWFPAYLGETGESIESESWTVNRNRVGGKYHLEYKVAVRRNASQSSNVLLCLVLDYLAPIKLTIVRSGAEKTTPPVPMYIPV